MNLAAASGCGAATSNGEAAYYASFIATETMPERWESLPEATRQSWELVALAVAARAFRALATDAHTRLMGAMSNGCNCQGCEERRSSQS